MANEVEIKLTVEEKQALSAIAKVTKATDKLGDEAKSSGKKMDSAFSSFAGNLAAMAASKAFSGIVNGIQDTVKAAGELEVFETQFKTMLGSTKAAQDQLRELQEFAASTPFQLPGLASSTRQLLSFGVEQENIIPTLQTLGDIASGVGAQIDELTIPFGRLQASQKLTLVELDKFADRGVNIYKELADQTGTSMANIRDDISKGKIPFDEFNTALSNLTSEGGTFFGGMEAQSKTLAGVLSTLGDNFFNLQGEIGNAFKPAIIEAATEITEIMKSLADLMVQKGPALSKTFSEIAEVLVVTPAKFWVDFFSGDAVSSVTDMETELARVNEQIRLTEMELTKATNATGLTGFLVDVTGSTESIQQKLGELLATSTEINSEISKLGGGKKEKDIQSDIDFLDDAFNDFDGDVGSDPAVVKAKAVFDEVSAIKAEQKLIEQEQALIEKEAKGLATDTELEELRTFETKKLELKKATELEKAGFIAGADKREKAMALASAKSDLDMAKLTGKQKADLLKTQQAQELKDKQTFFSVATGLASSENKTLAAIGKAAALTQLAIKTPEAIASSFAFGSKFGGPILGFTLGGIAAAAMGAQAAKIAGVSGFANGGVVGGFQGATSGADNRTITARDGEMFLNAPQQKQLFDVANGGESGGDNSAVMAALSQPIIIQVDGREIARANRTAIQEGFAA